MLSVSMIGSGAIGLSVLSLLQNDADVSIDNVIVAPATLDQDRERVAKIAPAAKVITSLDQAAKQPDLLVECAGHSAIEMHVLPALKRGIPCVVVSIGALSDTGLARRLEEAAQAGKTQVQLLSGAIGGIDALAAARIGGLDSVVYTGRKQAGAWKDTPADEAFDLDALTEPTVIFEGSAGDAARLYPKNANVAATLSLAGIGLDRTQVRLIADPAAKENVHHYEARGTFGSFELTMRNDPLPANPKTSALTVYSVVRAVANHGRVVVV